MKTPVAIIFICLALMLYTSSIFTEKFIVGHLKKWIIFLFSLGFTSDVIGTSLMYKMAEVKFSISLHSICGYSALIIMCLHLIWAILAIRGSDIYQKNFTRYSIYAWFIWLIAFISGTPKISNLIMNWMS
ncbi:TIGR03987 family protein [Candidatus Nomurabacteria bacterium]|nr:TIGR03987 family protein [Candidatus Nomurabacteria bacterium]